MKFRWKRLLPRYWSITVKLSFTLLVLTLFPMTITSYMNLQSSLNQLEATEYQNLELLATRTATQLDQLIIDNKRVVVQISLNRDIVNFLSPTFEDKDSLLSHIDEMLENILHSNPDYFSVFLLNKDGLCLTSTNPNNIGNYYAFRQYYQEAIKGNTYASDIVVGSTTNRPGLFFSTPVRDHNNEIQGVIVIKFQGESIWKIVDSLRIGEDGYGFLIDNEGIIISHPDKSLLYHSLGNLSLDTITKIDPKTTFRIPKIKSLNIPKLSQEVTKTNKIGNLDYYSPLTKRREIVGYAPLKQNNWVLVVNESEKQFAKPLHELAYKMAISVLIIGSFVILITLTLARNIVKPVRRLTDAARSIKAGIFEKVTINLKNRDEIQVLTKSFNQMVQGLQERERERDIFGRVVSPEVRERLLEGQLELGGETCWVSVLFADIRSFSTLSEAMNPQEVVSLLNEYLTEMTNAIQPEGGYINNFIGDAIVAIFGVPLSLPNAELNAVKAALNMCDRLEKLNKLREARGEIQIEMGIGISTGEAVAGQIGSLERLLYTVIGDAVNVAARLETLTKEYEYSILVNKPTIKALTNSEDIQIKNLGLIKVKGRTQLVEVYAIYN